MKTFLPGSRFAVGLPCWLFDNRVEKRVRFGPNRSLGLFFDVFNAMNSNTAVNLNWRSGAAFEKATTVLGPRIAKFGAKFDW